MKKTLLVLSLAAVLVLAFSGAAFAKSPTLSTGGLTNGGAGTPATAPSNNPTAYLYLSWSDASGLYTGNGTDASPHGNYSTSSAKCVVCHSVHDAGAGVAGVGSATAGASSDTLLRTSANGACGYCHVTVGGVVNGKPVYDGVMPANNSGGTGHYIATACNECHTSVHGVGADVSVPAVKGFLLKTLLFPANPTQTTFTVGTSIAQIDAQNTGANAGISTGWTEALWAAPTDKAMLTAQQGQMMGIFCAQCHIGAYATNQANAATNLKTDSVNAVGDKTPLGLMSGHRVGANVTASSNWNSAGISSSAITGGMNVQVAWAPASTCWSCHDAKDTFSNASFPHSFGGSNFGLTAADFQGGTTNLLTENGTGKGSTVLQDGVCLKCHRGSAATGVGLTF